MYRFKFFMVFVLVAFAVGFIGFTNASIAGSPFIQNFELKPPNLSGQTCDDTGDACANIAYCDEEIVSQVKVFTAKPGKIRIDFCAEFMAVNCMYGCSEVFFECSAFVDNNQAQPGWITLTEAEQGDDDSRCFTWYAPVSGNYQTHTTQVRCTVDDTCGSCGGGNSCDVDINEYTHSVFYNKL